MVVKRLETFTGNIPGALVLGNLKSLIEKEIGIQGIRPTIVLDESSASFVFHDRDSVVYNGQPSILKQRIEEFVENIISFGANLVVFLRGNIEKDKNVWFLKCKSKIIKEHEAFQSLGKERHDVLNHRTASDFCCSNTFASISKEHYKVFTSLNYVHEEAAKFAIKEKCLAIIGQDSNYLIYEGIRYYVLMETLNPETLDCKIYNREKLTEQLGLKGFQLPLFATLCGNDVVQYFSLKEFHKRISRERAENLLPSIAEKVKHTSADPYRHILYVVELIANPSINEHLIRKSLDMYLKSEENHNENVLMKFARERTKLCHWSFPIYRLIKEKQLFNGSLTRIYDKTLSTFELLRPLRKNLYGILFDHASDTIVQEYFFEEIMTNFYRKATPNHVVLQMCSSDHPGLIELFENRTPEMEILRWDLFLISINKTFIYSAATTIPEKLLFPVLALHYLEVVVPLYFPRKKVFKKKFEMEAFLITAILVSVTPEKCLENIKEPEPDLWLLQLTTLYLDTCFTLNLLNESCGFVISKQKACVCNYFDGKLIFFIYNKLERGATYDEIFDGNVVMEILFYTLLEIIKQPLYFF